MGYSLVERDNKKKGGKKENDKQSAIACQSGKTYYSHKIRFYSVEKKNQKKT